jgi:hypothetical protein
VRVDQPAVEGTLLDELEIEAHAVRKEPLPAADHAGGDEQVVLVHQSGSDRLRREVRTVDGEVAISLGLSLRTASGSKLRSILVFVLDTDARVVEYTIFSAAWQSRAYCRM